MSSFATNLEYVTSSDGAQIYADAAGDPHKPSIVFIHGSSGSATVFDNIFANEGYKRDFHLVRYDMRGHGRSMKPENAEGHSSKLYADDFAAVARKFALKRPVVVGWSLGSTVVADVAAHLPADTMSGVVYLSALPYIGPIMQRVGTPTILGLLPGLLREDSVNTLLDAAIKFVDSLFLDPAAISWETRCLWLGVAVSQPPAQRKFVLGRPQDPSHLFELGAKGLPLLIINGTRDNQVRGNVVVEEMKPHFTNLEVAMIEKKGSHVVFYENMEEVMDKITRFVLRVQSAVSLFGRIQTPRLMDQ